MNISCLKNFLLSRLRVAKKCINLEYWVYGFEYEYVILLLRIFKNF